MVTYRDGYLTQRCQGRQAGGTYGRVVCLLMILAWLMIGAAAQAAPVRSAEAGDPPLVAERVILFVLEGVNQSSLQAGPMPQLRQLVKEGAVTWSAQSPTPDLRLPSMASLFTGLSVEKHGVDWDTFDFARGYPRAPTLFDYMDLGGGKDTAIFFMDESLYQLARPEPYIDYQVCGPLRPECTTGTVVKYVRDYMVKGASGEGYGRRILDLPHLLIVHLPEPGRVGEAEGWASEPYRAALREIDVAVEDILEVYEELGLLDRAAVIVTALNGRGSPQPGTNGNAVEKVPWIMWGHGIKAGHRIEQPVSLLDTGATVMRMLGLETYTEWDSHAVEEVFEPGILARSTE